MKLNKSHTATINRIARRYGVAVRLDDRCEVHTRHGLVGIETAATVARRIRSLKKHEGPAYVAVTNKEALIDALRATEGSRIGVMDPQGNIVKMAEGGDPVSTTNGDRGSAGNNRSAGNRQTAVGGSRLAKISRPNARAK